MRRRYEIHDDQWEQIKEVLLPERKQQGGRPAKDNRMMLNAMLWIAKTGAPWRDLPEYYGSQKTVYTRFRRWQMSGVWEQILEQVSIEPDFENVMADSTIVRVHQHGAGAKGGSNFRLSAIQRRTNDKNPCHSRMHWAIPCGLNLRETIVMIVPPATKC